MHLGVYIQIEAEIGPYTFAGLSVSSGTQFVARIDPDKYAIFDDWIFKEEHPSACSFLRPYREKIVCTIHDSWPAQCKIFRCVVMRIQTKDNKEVGRVTGTMALHTDDPDLRTVWEEDERIIPRLAEDAEQRMQEFLKSRGYFVS